MRVTRQQENLVFHLGRREKDLLLDLLQLYPWLPDHHHTLSKGSAIPEQDAAQHLLEESMAEQCQQNKRQLMALISDSARLKNVGAGWELSLTAPDVEWLLQVLNDIRVGSWARLGCPEEIMDMAELTPEVTQNLWSMEMCGYFQMHFLKAFKPG